MNRRGHGIVVLFIFATAGKATAQLYNFSQCQADVEGILNGTLTVNGVTNETISSYIYDGVVQGMRDQLLRSQYLAVTYEGGSPLNKPSRGGGADYLPRLFEDLRPQSGP